MKPIFSKIRVLGTAALALFLTASCSDILDEQPRSSYDPTFFKTEKGVEGGVTSMYAHLRYIYGQAYYYNSCLTGTDEATWGWSADGNFKDADLSGVGNLTATTCRSDALWGTAFSNINTANGVIENGAEVGVNESLVSEARFFRAFDYFLLVQTFGGVPLDLGSGKLKFNITPSRTSVRNTVPEVYTKAIFPDLLTAIENLPANPRVTGGVTKTVARLYLAKAYLTYAWWLKNPNNIPTYPECQRTDPDGHDAAWYFQQAYDVAVTAIETPGPFGLQESFWMVNAGPNDRNMEILLYADHTQEDEYYNGGSLSYGGGGAPDNFAGWMMNWNYLGEEALVLGLEVAAPVHGVLEFVAGVFQKLHRLGVAHPGKVGGGHVREPLHQALVHKGVEEGHLVGTLLHNGVDDILDHGLGHVHIALEVAEGHLWLNHPELCGMARGVGLLCPEGGAEGVIR